MPVMLGHRHLWGVVAKLVAQHGLQAVEFARASALSAIQEDRQSEFAAWEAVTRALEEFVQTEPADGEWVN